MKKVEKNITLKEFKDLHNQRKSKTLTPYEKQKIRYTLKKPTEQNILIHLYTKFLYFGMKEFNQRKFDIKVEVGTYTDATITNNLNSLERKGYFTQEFKQVKGKNYNRTHFNINIQKLNEFLTTGDDLKPENFSRLIETLRRENEIVKPNPYTKTHKLDNKSKDDMLDNNTDSKTIEPIVGVKTTSDDDIPVKDIIEPKNEPDEVIEERTNSIEENINNDNNTTKTENFMKEEIREKVREQDFNERTKLFLKYKDLETVAPVLKDLILSFQMINYLYSSDYKKGLDKNLDDKKATLDILFDIRIKPLLNK